VLHKAEIERIASKALGVPVEGHGRRPRSRPRGSSARAAIRG
jgi:hypothetical protein